jgi:hypothetical protein
MDRFLAILSLALAFASLVPAFTATKTKTRIVAVVISVLLIGTIGVQSWSLWTERRHIDKVKDDMVRMFSSNNPMSFEQVYGGLNYVDYATATTAIDELVDAHTIHHRPVEVTSPGGAKYVVRVYNSVNFPIP